MSQLMPAVEKKKGQKLDQIFNHEGQSYSTEPRYLAAYKEVQGAIENARLEYQKAEQALALQNALRETEKALLRGAAAVDGACNLALSATSNAVWILERNSGEVNELDIEIVADKAINAAKNAQDYFSRAESNYQSYMIRTENIDPNKIEQLRLEALRAAYIAEQALAVAKMSLQTINGASRKVKNHDAPETPVSQEEIKRVLIDEVGIDFWSAKVAHSSNQATSKNNYPFLKRFK